ncbi:MAG: aminomethyl-transferring glycine dehydrogenase, partial [Candidatus Rokubacteria bacterium]|nr:aminomethyl-transferring glycine dehydrogenase [Candidatus Rokubacteria bacterium]
PWIEPVFAHPFFNEFVVRYTGGRTVDGVNQALQQAGILGGLPLRPWYPSLGEAALWCATESIATDQIDRVVNVLQTL